jgi:hypothetical protein
MSPFPVFTFFPFATIAILPDFNKGGCHLFPCATIAILPDCNKGGCHLFLFSPRSKVDVTFSRSDLSPFPVPPFPVPPFPVSPA